VKFLTWLVALAQLLMTACSVAPVAKGPVSGAPVPTSAKGLRGVEILLIRHAEKAGSGPALSPAGRDRAEAYVRYFTTLAVGSRSITPDYLIAGADSGQSWRPRLTLKPLSKFLGRPIDLRFGADRIQALAEALRTEAHGRCILICWRHGTLPELLSALGADPGKLLPDGRWPEDEYSWLLDLRYDQAGHLVPAETRRVLQGLMPGDAR